MNFHMNLRLRLVCLSRIQLPKRRLLHHVLLIYLLIILCDILRPIMHARAINVALFHLLTQLRRRRCRRGRRWRVVVHWDLLERFGVVVGVEERLFGWQIKLYWRHRSLSLLLLPWKCSAPGSSFIFRFYDLVCGSDVAVVVAASPGLLEGGKIGLKLGWKSSKWTFWS